LPDRKGEKQVKKNKLTMITQEFIDFWLTLMALFAFAVSVFIYLSLRKQSKKK